MDGLTISTRQDLLDTGKTTSELKRSTLRPQSDSDSQTTFASQLNTAIGETNRLQQVADKKMEDLAAGKTDNIAEVMIAVEKADISLRLLTQIRNKILDAYQEIMRMQV
jgi:flagellar hook-basal body complex protein FliE